jgi:hypothetical protein
MSVSSRGTELPGLILVEVLLISLRACNMLSFHIRVGSDLDRSSLGTAVIRSTSILSLLHHLYVKKKKNHCHSFMMMQTFISAGLLLTCASLVAASPVAAPAPTAAPNLEKRATCTFTDAASASKSKTDCATIVLDAIAVPSGTTLDLTDLTEGTHVIFEGTTTFGYEGK